MIFAFYPRLTTLSGSNKRQEPEGKRMTTFRSNFMSSPLEGYLLNIYKKKKKENEDITLSRNAGIRLLGDVTLYP